MIWALGKTARNPNLTKEVVRKATLLEVAIRQFNNVIKSFDLFVELSADAADEEVSVRWHFAQNDRGAIFNNPVRLRNGSEYDVTFLHSRDSFLSLTQVGSHRGHRRTRRSVELPRVSARRPDRRRRRVEPSRLSAHCAPVLPAHQARCDRRRNGRELKLDCWRSLGVENITWQ